MDDFGDQLDDFLGMVQETVDRASDPVLGAAVHREIVRQYRGMNLPVRSGRLRRSLTDPASADHVWAADAQAGRWSLTSRDPAVRYQAHRIPDLDHGAIYDVIRAHMRGHHG